MIATISASPSTAPENRRLGILCIIFGMALIIGSDTCIKWLSPRYAVHEIMLARSLVAIPVTLVIARFDGGWAALRTRQIGLHLVRGLLMVCANMSFFLGIAAMTVVDAVTLAFAAPLLITSLSVVLLGERVGRRRWTAIFIGFGGVVVMMRPDDEVFHLAALLPLGAAFFYALAQIMTRRLGGTARAPALALYIHLIMIAVSVAIGLSVGDGRFDGSGNPSLDFLLRAWVWPSSTDFGVVVLCGLCNGVAFYFLSQAYRVARAGDVAPFEYTSLPWAALLGFLIWGHLPDAAILLGAALIVGSGLYVLRREQSSSSI